MNKPIPFLLACLLWPVFARGQAVAPVRQITDLPGLSIRLGRPQPVGTRSVINGGGRLQETSLATSRGRTSVFASFVRYPAANFQVEWSNTYKNNYLEAPNTNPVWIKAGIEYPQNTVFPLKFSGRDVAEMSPGGTLKSDPLGISVQPIKGTVAAGSTTTSIVTSDISLFTNQTYTGCLLHFTTGANAGQELFITATAADGTTALATFTTQQFANPPNTGDKFTIYPVLKIRTYAFVDGGTYTADVGTSTGGTFTLTFNGQTTGAIAYNASPFAVETAIAAISSVNGPGAVKVTGASPTYTVRLSPTLPVNTQSLTGDGSSLTGGNHTLTVTQQAWIPLGYATLGGGQNPPYEGRITEDGAWSGNVSNTTTTEFGPIGLYGQPTQGVIPSFAIWGDSIITGTGNPDGTGAVGFFEIALANNYPYVKLSVGGNTFGGDSNSSTNVQAFVRQDASYGATFAVTDNGANDITTGAKTLPVLKAYALDWGRRMLAQGSIPIYCTLIPDTISSDGYTTTAGQTAIAAEAVRQGYNVWLADKTATGLVAQLGGKAYVIDDGAAVEVNLDGSAIVRAANGTISNGAGHYWKTAVATFTGTVTTTGTDSTHLGATGASFTSAAVGLLAIDATIHSYGYVTAQPSGTQLTVASWSNGTPANGDTFYVLNSYTVDGTHPFIRGHQALAAVVAAFLPKLTIH